MHVSMVLLLSVLSCTFAQDYGGSNPARTTSTSVASSTTAASTLVHTVAVGDGNLAYSPNSITATVGDTIEFHFFAPLHSVAQSDFASPCTPANGTAFFSGDISTSSGQNANVFTLAINDTNPIWFYCVIPTHCQAGMAGVINAPMDGSMTLAQYQAAAAKVGNSVAPANAQGGVLGPVKAATASSSTPSPSSKSAGVSNRGGVQWMAIAMTGVVAIGLGRSFI